MSDISTAISAPLQQDCSCSLAVQRRIFSCLGSEGPQTVVFLAELSYTELPGVDLSSLLTSWVTSTPPISVASTQLQVDPTCPVVITSLEPEACSAPTPTDSPANQPIDVTVIAIAVGVAVLFVVLIIIAIVIVAILFCRKQSIAKYRYI